jgi:hypothetical protein
MVNLGPKKTKENGSCQIAGYKAAEQQFFG